MRSKATGLLIILLVLMVGVDMTKHNYLKDTVIAFMSEGDRNTGADGFERDLKLAEIDARLSNLEAVCITQ